jgi:hypothetical protein
VGDVVMVDKITKVVNKILDEAKIVGGVRETYYSFASKLSQLPLICAKGLIDYYQLAYSLDKNVMEKIVIALLGA